MLTVLPLFSSGPTVDTNNMSLSCGCFFITASLGVSGRVQTLQRRNGTKRSEVTQSEKHTAGICRPRPLHALYGCDGLTAELHPHPHLSLLCAEGPELNEVMSSAALMSRPDTIIPSSVAGRRNGARQGHTVLRPSDPG